MSLSVEDVLEIQRLYVRYQLLFDERDRAGWLDCFTPDGVFEMRPRGSGEWSEPRMKTGHEELGAYFDWSQEHFPRAVRHCSTDLLVEGEGDRAVGGVTTLVFDYATGSPKLRISGRVQDELVKSDGKWRFQHRIATPDQ